MIKFFNIKKKWQKKMNFFKNKVKKKFLTLKWKKKKMKNLNKILKNWNKKK